MTKHLTMNQMPARTRLNKAYFSAICALLFSTALSGYFLFRHVLLEQSFDKMVSVNTALNLSLSNGTFEADKVSEILRDRSGFGRTGENYIVDLNGYLVTDSRFVSQPNNPISSRTENFIAAAKFGFGKMIHLDYRGTPVVSVASKINSSPNSPSSKYSSTILLSEIDVSEALAPLNQSIFPVTILLIALTLIIYLLMKRTATDTAAHLYKHNTDALFRIQDSERTRMAKDIDRQITPLINKLFFKARDANPNEMLDLVQQTKIKLSKISGHLKSLNYEKTTLTNLLEDFFQSLNESNNSTCFVFNKPSNLNEPKLPSQFKKYFYRATQELCENILKHAQAKNVFVHLTFPTKPTDTLIKLIIEDDGNSKLPQPTDEHIGLKSVQSRMSSIGGNFNYTPDENGGTVTEVWAPLPCPQPSSTTAKAKNP